MRAAIYARQSLAHQEGIDRQIARCKAEVAKRDDWELVATYQDEQSAAKSRARSTGWGQMLAAQKRGEFDVIVAVNLDRLLRSLVDLMELVRRDARLLTLDGQIDLTTEHGRFQATVLTAVAQFEIDRKSQRQIRANEYRTDQGTPVPGRRRFGYLGTDKKLGRIANTVADPAEAVVVRELFESFAGGESVYGLAKRLNNEDKRPTTGKREWRPLRVRETLQNKCYAGFIKSKGEYITSEQVEAIVSVELWQEVNNTLSEPSRTRNPGGGRKHWLSGLGSCAHCGALVKFTNGNYICSSDTAHFAIMEKYLDIHIALALAAAIHNGAEIHKGDREAVAALVAELQRLELETEYATADRIADRITRKQEVRRLDEVAREREIVSQQLAELRASNAAADIYTDALSRIGDQHPVSLEGDIWELPRLALQVLDLDLERRRDLLTALATFTVAKGRVTRERVTVAYRVDVQLSEHERAMLEHIQERFGGSREALTSALPPTITGIYPRSRDGQ